MFNSSSDIHLSYCDNRTIDEIVYARPEPRSIRRFAVPLIDPMDAITCTVPKLRRIASVNGLAPAGSRPYIRKAQLIELLTKPCVKAISVVNRGCENHASLNAKDPLASLKVKDLRTMASAMGLLDQTNPKKYIRKNKLISLISQRLNR